MICPDYLSQGLERVFGQIQEQRMRDVPILNQALRVEAVGFSPWREHCLGVLITPWFMNLMLLPFEGGEWRDLSVGEKQTHTFPSGAYEFILGQEAGIGRYQTCSLFSPMFEFADQEAAVATAESVMSALMDKENRDSTSMRQRDIERIWRGGDEQIEPSGQELSKNKTLDDRLEQPISRRQVLTGKFLSEPEQR